MYNTYKYEYFRATHMLAFTNSGRTINKKHCVKHNWRNGCNMKMVQRPFPLTHKSVSFNVFYIIPIDFRPKSSNDNIIFDEQIDRRAIKLNHIICWRLWWQRARTTKYHENALWTSYMFLYIYIYNFVSNKTPSCVLLGLPLANYNQLHLILFSEECNTRTDFWESIQLTVWRLRWYRHLQQPYCIQDI